MVRESQASELSPRLVQPGLPHHGDEHTNDLLDLADMILGDIDGDDDLGQAEKLPETPSGHRAIDSLNGIVPLLIELLRRHHLCHTLDDPLFDVFILRFHDNNYRGFKS